MKKHLSLALIALAIFSHSYAAEQYYTASSSEHLNKMGQLVDLNQQAVNYPCTAGGDLLVVYGTEANNQKYISTHSTLYPLYVQPGFEATPLQIPENQRTLLMSTQMLNLQTINPPRSIITFAVQRENKQPFFVTSVNFPMAKTKPKLSGTWQKIVSMMQVFVNDETSSSIHSTYPEYNYEFLQDSGLLVYKPVTHITGAIASWNQNTQWTDGRIGRHPSPIQYYFSPKPNDIPNEYNGTGFWICGSKDIPTHAEDKLSAKKSIVYVDKFTQH